MAVQMALFRRRDLLLLSFVVCSLFVWFHFTQFGPPNTPRVDFSHVEIKPSVYQGPMLQDTYFADNEPSANSTLGFGRIIAVSTKTSHRRTSLQLSADLTGLEMSIPDQPIWTDADVNEFRSKTHSVIGRGSALAWMGHLNALRWFLSQPYETALIIEDDINWDIHLRTRQIPLLHRAFHDLFSQNDTAPATPRHPEFRRVSTPAPEESYWPSKDKWEILHFGHCGDFFKPAALQNIQHTVYPDPNLPSFQGLHIDTQRFLAPLPVPSKHRLIHVSQRPLCTFAYAVTRASAARILKEFSTEEEKGGTQAYDVRILEACRDLGFKCWSVNPELFHHMDDQASEIKVASSTASEKAALEGSSTANNLPSEEDTRRAKARGTPNVGCGIRGIVDHVGTTGKVREVVRIAREIDGLCPFASDEVDALRGMIVEKGRPDLPINYS